MENKIELSENLFLECVQENCWDDDDNLVSVDCYFFFFGKECQAIVGVENLNPANSNYSMIESCSELHDSLRSLLEEQHVWQIIYAQIQLFVKNWNLKYQNN